MKNTIRRIAHIMTPAGMGARAAKSFASGLKRGPSIGKKLPIRPSQSVRRSWGTRQSGPSVHTR
jgi:hypothetical protein